MTFEIYTYAEDGTPISVGTGEIDGEQLDWDTADASLDQDLRKIKKAGGVPMLQQGTAPGEYDEVTITVPISDPGFLTAVSDWMMKWDFIAQ
jgi:hypothetical protein